MFYATSRSIPNRYRGIRQFAPLPARFPTPQGLHQDPIGNVYIVGSFQYTVDFDPTGNVFNVESEGLLDGYLLKIKPDGSW